MYNFEEYDSLWQESTSDYSRLLKPFLEDFFSKSLFSSILEVGCGAGNVAKIIQDSLFEGKYIGIDIDKTAVDYCNNHYKTPAFQFSLPTIIIPPTNIDLILFSLSMCEMSEKTINDYLARYSSHKLLFINPSSITQYYPTKVYKPFANKLLSRVGQKPLWVQKSIISNSSNSKYYHKIGGNYNVQATIYQRTLGDYIGIMKNNNYHFESYWNLTYTENTVKTAPVSKFEAVLFNFDKSG